MRHSGGLNEPDIAAYAKRVIHFVGGRVADDHQNGEAAQMLWNLTGSAAAPGKVRGEA
jgi:hypothetical protein